jgi:tetratricopeptide (TPR) repeat protein
MTAACGCRDPRRHLTAAGAVLVSVMLVACDSYGGVDAGAVPPPAVLGATVTGNYLAARHARAEGEDADAAGFLLAALKKAPDDPVLLSRAYIALTADGRVEEAVGIARRLLATDKDAALAHIVIAVGDMHAGRFEAAADRLQHVPESPFSTFLVPLLQAWAEFGSGRRDAAMKSLERLKDDKSVGVLYDVHAAWMADAAGDRDAALRHARAAVAAQPEPWLRLTELAGGIFERAGANAEAEGLYKAYLDRHPDSRLLLPAQVRLRTSQRPERDITTARDGAAEALFDGAGIAGRQNNRELALALGQLGLYLRPDFPSLQIFVGDILERAERYEQANKLYRSIEANPLALIARIGVARNLDRMDRFDESQAMLRRIAAERPNDPDPLSELGDILRQREKFSEAVEVYDQAIARLGPLQPRHWRLLYARGIALERSKQWPRAEADFLQALQFEPDEPFVLNYLGYSWVEQGKNLDKAEEMIRKAVELRPSDGYIIDSLGWVLFRLGRHEEAVVHLERAVELKPEDPVINDHLGDAYWAVGRQREARYQWQTALASDPEPELKTALEQKLQGGLPREASAEAR